MNPLYCGRDGINANAWKIYVPVRSRLMTLGRQATKREVKVAGCNFRGPIGGLNEIFQIYELVARYNNWRLDKKVYEYITQHC